MSNRSRQLAAIMFTDIVGYTKLMGEDEEKAFEVLRKNRSLQQPLIEKFNGRWLKEIGDGVLASFDTVSDAVYCAKKIHETCLNEEDLKLRIGIHLGEVVFEDDDVFGDGVNIASRLEALATAGGIYVSESVFRNIQNKEHIHAQFVREVTLKNVKIPVRVYEILTAENDKPRQSKHLEAENQSKSIAVLPLVNMSNDPDQEYFSDGMSEEIINKLSQVKDMRVIARTSAFAFKGKNEDIREIGKKLDVGHLLEGSVRKAGDKFRITAQLINVADGSHIWSQQFNREINDVSSIFDVQDEISLAIVDRLKVNLLENEKDAIAERFTENLEAYNLYLKGEHSIAKLTAQGYADSFDYFEQSLKKDPEYALAYVGLARLYISMAFWGNTPPREAYPKAKENIEKALTLNRNLAEAHGAIGFINTVYDWDFKNAGQEIKLALQLNPNSAWNHRYYGWYFTFNRQHDAALEEAKIAANLDPLNSYFNSELGNTYILAGQYDMAIEQLKKTISMDPNYFQSHLYLGYAYYNTSQFQKANEEFKQAATLSDNTPHAIALLSMNYKLMGEQKLAEKYLNLLVQRSKKEYVSPTLFAWNYFVRGDMDKNYEYNKQAVEVRDSYLPWALTTDEAVKVINTNPRLQALLKETGLDELQ